MDGVARRDLGRRVSSKIGPAATKPAFLSKNKDLFVPNKLKRRRRRERNSESFVSFQVLKETASKEKNLKLESYLGKNQTEILV